MTLLELKTDIDTRYPNAFTDAQKVVWINEGISVLSTDIGEIDTWIGETTADTALYALQDDMRFENIKSVIIDDVVYIAAGQNDSLVRPSYMLATEGYIAIYPEPATTGLEFSITYQVQPPDVSDDTDTIDLRTNYIPALKYYVLRIMAEVNDDIAKANNFGDSYNAELMRIKMDKYKMNGKYPTTQIVTKHSGKARRLARRRNYV